MEIFFIIALVLVVIAQIGYTFSLKEKIKQLEIQLKEENKPPLGIKKSSQERKYTQSEYIVDDPSMWHDSLSGDILKKDLSQADPNSLFYNRKIVITGDFPIDRYDLAVILKVKMGADIDKSVAKSTNFLLVGIDPGPAKVAKAEELGVEKLTVEETMRAIKNYQ